MQSEAGQPPRPASALAAAMEFNVDSLFADDHEGPPAPLSQRAESTDAVQDGASRFGRWFQLEHSPSTAKSLPPQLEQQPVSQQSATEPQQSDSFAEKQQQQSANEAAHIQVWLMPANILHVAIWVISNLEWCYTSIFSSAKSLTSLPALTLACFPRQSIDRTNQP